MSSAEKRFLDLVGVFVKREYHRTAVKYTINDEVSDVIPDANGQQEFCDFLEEQLNLRLTSDRINAFHAAHTLRDLYDKLCIMMPGFRQVMSDTPSSSSDEGEAEQAIRKEPRVLGDALSNLIDAGEDAGEDMLAAQLRLVQPVILAARTHIPGKCVECEDRLAILDCNNCRDEFCAVCYQALHRKGNRSKHTPTPKPGHENDLLSLKSAPSVASMLAADDGIAEIDFSQSAVPDPGFDTDLDFKFRAQFIPLRLGNKERIMLRMLQAQLSVSTYTDAIDRPELKANKRVHAQILKICAFLSGVSMSCSYEEGLKLLTTKQWKVHEGFFRQLMEVGRRYKVLNPDRMRTEYGRLMYLMMDASRNEVQQLLGFNVRAPMVTVASFLKERGAEGLLDDKLVEIATRAIDQMSDDGKKSRYDIRAEVKQKESAVKKLAQKYSNSKIDDETIKLCLYSIGDNRTFLLQHRDPVQRMIGYLKRYFGPQVAVLDDKYSLAIYGGTDGSRLSHSHDKQYNYVLQSLTLWREILNDMFRLWVLSEEDMLDPACPYKLEDTGQGYQRVQEAPRVAKAMRDLLFRTQAKLGSWVGSSVVHLGDKNVPNALLFLDKYTQVARILGPICLCLDRLPELCEQPKTKAYIDTVFGGIETCRKDILVDFFRSAFDGSGADNFFDAGSCIDGRLTSAWNWCSQVADKRFFPVLKLSGFTSFDGDFEE